MPDSPQNLDRGARAKSPAAPNVPHGDSEAISIARKLASRFAAGASERDRERRLPWDELDLFSRSGLGGMTVPKAYGGPQCSYLAVAEVFKIIAAADPSIAQIAHNHIGIVDLTRFDPDETRRRFIYEKALRGLRFGSAISEQPDKSEGDLQTKIARRGDGFVVSGEKFHATGALFAHLVPVAAVDRDGKHLLAFVERQAPGLSVIDDWSGFGQRTMATGTVRLNNVFVLDDHVLRIDRALDEPSIHGPAVQVIDAAIDAGIALRAIEEAIRSLREHRSCQSEEDRRHAPDDLFVIREIGDLKVKMHAAEAVLKRAARKIDVGLADETIENVAAASAAVAEATILAAEIALLAANKLFELAGSKSVLAMHNFDRHWRDARTHTVGDPLLWKFHEIGNYCLNGIALPRSAWL